MDQSDDDRDRQHGVREDVRQDGSVGCPRRGASATITMPSTIPAAPARAMRTGWDAVAASTTGQMMVLRIADQIVKYASIGVPRPPPAV